MSAHAEEHWAGLLRSALLGTERTPPPAPPADGSALAAALHAAADPSPESTLLSAAAATASFRRASRLPARDDRALPEPAPAETSDVCPPAAAGHLALMLGGTHDDALAEWLAEAARQGWVAPPALLPRLLTAAGEAGMRGLVPASVLGERGRWLAAERPEWAALFAGASKDVSEEDERAAWETLAPGARPRFLSAVRHRDAARGLALLRHTWAAEPAAQRAALLERLELGLSMDDEPFLEAALDDRRKEVRAAAAGLLARLAGSRLVQRMTERARGWLSVSPGRTGLLARVAGGAGPAVDVRLPEACDAAMERDGIVPKPPPKWGERAWWLAQAVAAVPPGVWSADAGAGAGALLAAVKKGEWAGALLPAWAAAAVRHRDADWAAALLDLGYHAETVAAGVNPSPEALLDVLSPDAARWTVMAAVVHAKRLAPGGSAVRLLAALRVPWGCELTRAVLRASAAEDGRPDPFATYSLGAWGRQMDPACALEMIDVNPEAYRGPWTDLVRHRHAMLEALKR